MVLLDTERNRALKYAPSPGKKANGIDHFDFLHVPFAPPFGSLDFRDAVMQQRAHKPACIIIDSMSDEHEGDGGLLDMHEKNLDRMAGDDWAKRERVGQAAWIKPKAERLEMLGDFMQMMTPVIFCFRAREKVKQIKNDRGKMEPTNIGWTPIAPPEIIHSMDLFALLPIRSDGVPMWKGGTAYEDFTIKLPRQFAGLFPEGAAINQQMGQAMSIWAMGDAPVDTRTAANKPTAHTPREASNRDVSAEGKSSQSGGPQTNQAKPAQDAGESAGLEAAHGKEGAERSGSAPDADPQKSARPAETPQGSPGSATDASKGSAPAVEGFSQPASEKPTSDGSPRAPA